MAYRELDQLILLFTIEEGADRIRSLQRITFARLLDWITNANLPAGNSKEGNTNLSFTEASISETNLSFTEASISEEPSAVVPHAGICAGAVG